MSYVYAKVLEVLCHFADFLSLYDGFSLTVLIAGDEQVIKE